MAWNGKEEQIKGALERGFSLELDGERIPGVYWQPEGGSNRLVLLGHGGTANKKAAYIVHMAELLAARGIATVAIDGPGHGERATEAFAADPGLFAQVWQESGGTATVLRDWRAALDFIEKEEGARPTGWWGLSMGTMMGLPVTATEARICVALLGLMGDWGPNQQDLLEHAPNVTCPVRFLVQWDDEIVPRANALTLYDRLGTGKKTLHANPGKHSDVPAFEMAASADYLAEQLQRHLR